MHKGRWYLVRLMTLWKIYNSEDIESEEEFREGALKVLRPILDVLTESEEESSKG